jgi:hypothetical protein
MSDEELAAAAADIRARNPERAARSRAICWLLFRAGRRVTIDRVLSYTERGSKTDIGRDIDAWETELRQAVAAGVPGVDLPEQIAAKLSTAVGEIMAMARDAARAEFDGDRQRWETARGDLVRDLDAARLAAETAQDARQQAEARLADAEASLADEHRLRVDLEQRLAGAEAALRDAQATALRAAEQHQQRLAQSEDELRTASAAREVERTAAAAELRQVREQAIADLRTVQLQLDQARLDARDQAAGRERAEQRALASEEQARARISTLSDELRAAQAQASAAHRAAAEAQAEAQVLTARLEEARAAQAALTAAVESLRATPRRHRRAGAAEGTQDG